MGFIGWCTQVVTLVVVLQMCTKESKFVKVLGLVDVKGDEHNLTFLEKTPMSSTRIFKLTLTKGWKKNKWNLKLGGGSEGVIINNKQELISNLDKKWKYPNARVWR